MDERSGGVVERRAHVLYHLHNCGSCEFLNGNLTAVGDCQEDERAVMMRSARRTPSAKYRSSCLGAVAVRRGSAMGHTTSGSCVRLVSTYVVYRCCRFNTWPLGPSSIFFIFHFFFFHAIYYLRPSFFSLPPSRSSDPGSHSRLFFPLPTTVRALQFYREKISALFLSSSTRVELCLPALGALSS